MLAKCCFQVSLAADFKSLDFAPARVRFTELDLGSFFVFSLHCLETLSTVIPHKIPVKDFVQHYFNEKSRNVAELKNVKAQTATGYMSRAIWCDFVEWFGKKESIF